MAYIDLYYHFVFRTKHSLRVIDEEHEDKLYNYIYGISSHLGCNIKKINGMPDHIHIAVSTNAGMSPSVYMREVKSSSSKWIIDNKMFPGFQGWGKSYFCATFSYRDLDKVRTYISNQKIHHHKMSLNEELESFFKAAGIEEKLQYFLCDK